MTVPPPSVITALGDLAIVRLDDPAFADRLKRAADMVGAIDDPIARRAGVEAVTNAVGRDSAALILLAGHWARAGMGGRRRDPSVPRLGIELLERALALNAPGIPTRRVHADLAFLNNEIRRYAEAERHARLADGYENALYHLWLAEALYEQGRFTTDPQCAVDLAPLATPLVRRAIAEAEAEWAARTPPPGDRVILLISVDAVYFKQFAPALFLSARRFDAEAGFHFHIINPDDECLALVRTMEALAGGTPLTVTAERWPPGDPALNNVYYACSRMLLAERLARENAAAVVIADADILFRVDPTALVARTRGHDLATIEFVGEPLCDRYNASFFVVNHTPTGTAFLKLLERFLSENLKRHYLWMIDQVALYVCARRLFDETGGDARILVWSEDVLSIHHHPDASIWSGATVAKWGDTPYTRLRDEILRENGLEPPR